MEPSRVWYQVNPGENQLMQCLGTSQMAPGASLMQTTMLAGMSDGIVFVNKHFVEIWHIRTILKSALDMRNMLFPQSPLSVSSRSRAPSLIRVCLKFKNQKTQPLSKILKKTSN